MSESDQTYMLALREALEASWDRQTAYGAVEQAGNPALGQCYPTSRVVQHYYPATEIINPPYQSKNKIQQELGRAYVNRVRGRFPDVPGRADYCVYWFRKAHD